MRSRRSSPRSPADPSAGFTLVELLATLGIAGLLLASAVSLTATQTRTGRRHVSFLEAHQALRASLDTLTRDARLGGACLPTDGEFIALDGADDAGGDSLTVRAGRFENQTCVLTTLTDLVPAGDSSVEVESAAGFRPEMLAYIRHPNGGGQILEIAAAEGATLGFGTGLVQEFPAGSSVYAVEERTYAVDRTDPENPILTLTIDRGDPRPFAVGLQDLQVQYVLDRNCSPCDVVDLPGDTPEWRIVHSLIFTATVRPPRTAQDEEPGAAQQDLVASSTAKVRNLLP